LVCLIPLLAQPPVHVDYTCTQEDLDSFGLTCFEDQPCPVFFEVTAVDSFGSRLFVAGDIHTATTTLYGVVLSTEDGGASWSEAIPRLRSTAFDQFQIIENHGWLSGQRLEPLPQGSFFMITTDGGKSWRQRPVFEETRVGSIAQFWFESPENGELIFDDSLGKTTNQELHATKNGGETWELRQKSAKPLRLKPHPNPAWVVSTATGSATYLIERNVNGKKETAARFLIHIGDCK
jgi:photosystem II stability/assembly factor-like uncharacterized protein